MAKNPDAISRAAVQRLIIEAKGANEGVVAILFRRLLQDVDALPSIDEVVDETTSDPRACEGRKD